MGTHLLQIRTPETSFLQVVVFFDASNLGRQAGSLIRTDI